MRRKITKRRRLNKHPHIIRGGTIDDDVKSIIIKLKTYDHNAIANLLEKIKNDEEFKAACRERDDGVFGTIIKDECHYTKNFENFVDEMLTSAIVTLRTAHAREVRPLINEAIIEQLYGGENLNTLIEAFMRKYIETKSGPCLSVIGSAATLQQRQTPLSTPRQTLSTPRQTLSTPRQTLSTQTPRQTLSTPRQTLSTPRQMPKQGGSRRKRIKRGGEPITIAIVVTGFVFLLYIAIRNRRRFNPSDIGTWGVGSGKHTSVDDLARARIIKELKDKMLNSLK
jgi:hypothetical protein